MFHGPPESPGSAPTALSLCLRVRDLLNLHGSELRLKSPVGHPFSGSLLVLCPRETRRAASTSSLPLGWHKEGATAPGPGRTPSDTRVQRFSAHARQFLQPPLHCKLVSGLRLPSLCVHPGVVWGRPTSVPPLCIPVPLSAPLLGRLSTSASPSSPAHPLALVSSHAWPLHPRPPPGLLPALAGHWEKPLLLLPSPPRVPWNGPFLLWQSAGAAAAPAPQGTQLHRGQDRGGRWLVLLRPGLAQSRKGSWGGREGEQRLRVTPRSSYKGRPPVIYRKWVEPGLTGDCAGVDRPHTAQQGGSEPRRSSWTVNTAT